MPKTENIFLIGPMAAGKSSVGPQLAAILQLEFLDLDSILHEQLGLSIANIFAKFGETYFRSIEAELIANLTTKRNIVLATGGGCILQPKTCTLLQQRGLICYLQVDVANQLRRIKDPRSRPLLQTQNLLEVLTTLALQRNYIYATLADISLDTSGRTCNQVVLDLVHKICAHNFKNPVCI